ncbi:MAG: mercury transporter MerT [Alphaproteobacteria bacterium]|nr:mercury transporter MerT [Alphaproteobacteria bacterium]
MATTETQKQDARTSSDSAAPRSQRLFAAGGVIGAVLASACCVLPLLFVTLGISGAWIANLTALEPYKPYVAAAAVLFIGLGFRQVYFRQVYFQPGRVCEDGSYCARPQSAVITKIVLWCSALLILMALTINWWAPLLY